MRVVERKGGTKLERFLPKNWVNGEVSKSAKI